jgi:hypothetical protein
LAPRQLNIVSSNRTVKPPHRTPIALLVLGNLPLLLVSLAGTKPVVCGPEAPRPFDTSSLVGLLVVAVLFLAGYAPYRWLARRLWSRGFGSKLICLLPIFAVNLASLALAAVLLPLVSGAFC